MFPVGMAGTADVVNRWRSGEFTVGNFEPCRIKLLIVVDKTHKFALCLRKRLIERRRLPRAPNKDVSDGKVVQFQERLHNLSCVIT